MFKKLLKNRNSSGNMIALMSFANLFGNALTMVSGLLVARWLLPDELGLFNSLSIVTSYIILVQAGIPSGLSRELPYYMGKGEEASARKVTAVSHFWELWLGITCFALSVIAGLYFLITGNLEFAAGSLVIGVTSFQAFYTSKYLKILFRANTDFNKLSIIQIIVSVASFVTIYFVFKFGFYGLCIRSVLICFVDYYFTWKWKPLNEKPVWDKAKFIELLKVGAPIYWVANVYSLWPVVQRTVVLSLGGTKALGIFALCVIVESSLDTIINSISSISFPKMAFEWGKGASFKDVLKIPLKPTGIVLLLNIIVAIAGWYLLPYFVQAFLPNYMEGVPAAQWMLIVCLIKVPGVFSNIYMIIKKNTDRLISYGCGFIVWAILVYAMYLRYGFELDIFPKALIFAFIATYIVDGINFKRYTTLRFERN